MTLFILTISNRCLVFIFLFRSGQSSTKRLVATLQLFGNSSRNVHGSQRMNTDSGDRWGSSWSIKDEC